MSIVYTQDEMNDAIAKFAEYDLVFVDTAGFSHKNEKQRNDMKALLGGVNEEYNKEVYLVLSATTKYADLLDIVDSYREIADYKLIFTKLDETTTYGNLLNIKLTQKDVFVNIAGGLRVTDLAMDLSVIAAVLSSNVDTAIEPGWCMAGEVGLSGEVRPINRIEQRISEAEKLGFTDIILPKHNISGLDTSKYHIKIHAVRKVEEALRELFG